MPQKNEYIYAKRATLALMVLYTLVSIGLLVYCIVVGENLGRAVLFPLFLLIPLLFKWLKLEHCYRLYVMLYLFILFAYSFGCVYGAFVKMEYMDKVSHFVSGFVFTLVGICLYLYFAGPKPGGLKGDWALASFFGLGFSSLIAILWEVCEYFDFAWFGNDSQNHLTTGVFDTMHDLMACLLASVLTVVAFALYRYLNLKLAGAAIAEEFYDKNVEGREGPVELVQ